MTKQRLLQLIKNLKPNDQIAVAPTPGITGWVNDISTVTYKTRHNGTKIFILSLEEETISEEELNLNKN